MIARVMAKTGERVRAREAMYQVVAQSVLLYISESWVVTGWMLKDLEGFHNWAVRRITGTTATHGEGGEWEYTPVVAEMEGTGLHPIR